ncbi:MBL fold metallo-hydrolase [Bacillus sp. FJAT-42376]|uniref:MBL fold metallo-hydrolase n=1 Tax=Bacillus sp. FJAT-42376 TaxID=2014076 RepID=UPI000F4D9973|nr:MBL fold metallo-hydrolase [Bacillus sp. FJAT-42376]AZB42257.1 MBL fold metallo-hydrolase [Bacillus sp. FJAT-42376]
MKVTVIGQWGGYPGPGEASSGYLLEKNGYSLLLDCGSAVLSQLQLYTELKALDAVLISHYHHDHVADIGPLQYGRLVSGFLDKDVPVLPIYGHNGDQDGFDRLTYKHVTEGRVYDPDQPLQIGPFQVRFLQTDHPAECYAFRITDGESVIVYTADSSFKEEFIPFSEGADLLISECNFYAEQDGKSAGHMNCHDAAVIARDADVKQCLLSHLPHFGNHQDLLNEAKTIYNGSIQLASKGWTWSKDEGGNHNGSNAVY